MIPFPQLTLDRKDAERVIKHFLDTGHQFHSPPDQDPELGVQNAVMRGGLPMLQKQCLDVLQLMILPNVSPTVN
jgi:hypothetical protein